MAGSVVLARLFTFEIDDGTDSDTFVEIDGLTSAGPSGDTQSADGNHYGTAGYNVETPAQRGLSYDLEGKMLYQADNALDPGQARLKALANEIGDDAVVPFKITGPRGDTREGDVFVSSFADGGGGLTDNAEWSASIQFVGAWTDTPADPPV